MCDRSDKLYATETCNYEIAICLVNKCAEVKGTVFRFITSFRHTWLCTHAFNMQYTANGLNIIQSRKTIVEESIVGQCYGHWLRILFTKAGSYGN